MKTTKELAELLLKYGDHKLLCNHREHPMYNCSCGWNKAVDVAMEIAFGGPEYGNIDDRKLAAKAAKGGRQ